MGLARDNHQLATHLLAKHTDASPPSECGETGECAFCGHSGLGLSVDEAVSRKYFSDHPIMQADTGHVCESCSACMDTRTLKQGHWIAHRDGVLQPSTGGLLDVFRDLNGCKYDPPLAVHVTSSPIRSSHAYLWTPVNATNIPLTVAFDRQTIRIESWENFESLLRVIEDLRLNGFTFDEIRSGEPRVRNLREIGRESYQTRAGFLEPYRRTPRLELALTLSRGSDDQPRTDLAEPHNPLT